MQPGTPKIATPQDKKADVLNYRKNAMSSTKAMQWASLVKGRIKLCPKKSVCYSVSFSDVPVGKSGVTTLCSSNSSNVVKTNTLSSPLRNYN